jgi:hypothetical protein
MVTKLTIMLLLLWAGMIVAISFLESWVKFRAPTLTKPIGLDVGRTVFRFFHTAQCGLFLILVVLSILAQATAIQWTAIIILAGILALQLAWLFPKLSQRVDIIQAGNMPAHSSIHTVYGILEVMKLFILVALGWSLMQ